MDNKQAVVLGQRRSGTSMVAGILYYLGIPMGKKATPQQQTKKNKDGFFEDRDIVKVSEDIITYVETNQQAGSMVSAARIEFKFDEQIKEVIDKKEGDIWGFKDVNQLRTHKFFRKHLSNPYYLVITRNFLDTAKSFWEWHKEVNKDRTFMECLMATIQKNELLLKLMGILKGNLIMVSYDKAKREPEKTVDSIIKFLEIKPTKEQREKAINHIK